MRDILGGPYCCICFGRFGKKVVPWKDDTGQKWDICTKCKDEEVALLAARELVAKADREKYGKHLQHATQKHAREKGL